MGRNSPSNISLLVYPHDRHRNSRQACANYKYPAYDTHSLISDHIDPQKTPVTTPAI